MTEAKKNRRHAARISEAGSTIEYVAPSPRVLDLSLNGAFVLDTRPFHMGESVEFRLWLGPRDSIVVQGTFANDESYKLREGNHFSIVEKVLSTDDVEMLRRPST